MHGMFRDQGTLDREEGTGSDMQADGFRIDILFPDPLQNRLGEMQAGRRSCYGTSDMGIQRLVAFDVDFFRFTVQIRRNGDCPAYLQDPGERRAVFPCEFHGTRLSIPTQQPGFQAHIRGFLRLVQSQDVLFPFLGVPDDAFPGTGFRSGESRCIFDRLDWFQAKYFDVGPGRALEMHAGRDDFGIVEHHQRILRKKIRQFPENMFIDLPVFIVEQFGGISFGKRILGDSFVRKRIIVILDVDLWNHSFSFQFSREVNQFSTNSEISFQVVFLSLCPIIFIHYHCLQM